MARKTPHVLRASSHPGRMLQNLKHILDEDAFETLQEEINANVISLFELGEGHYEFARRRSGRFWRQRISRFYYGAYNVRRAVQLHYNGTYSQDASDHRRMDTIPGGFSNKNRYTKQLVDLREDRNLADYDHAAAEKDLVLSQNEAEALVEDFLIDARSFLEDRGLSI